jgi:predicted NACHT family NTPase
MPTDQPFDPSIWRERVAAWWRESAPNLGATMRRLGLRTAYGTLAASAWLPLLAAYADDPGPAVAALAALTSGVGSNLLSNLVQGAYERGMVSRKAERELAERPELRAEYEQTLNDLGALESARAALGEDWAAFEKRLRWELERMGGDLLRIESGGGAVVLGTVKVRYAALVDRERGEARRLGALEAALQNRRLVLLGAPGSGKSTFVGHLAFCLAMAHREPGAGWLEQLPGWPEAEASALPVVIVLRDLARWAAAQGLERGNVRTLSDFVAAWLNEHDLGDFFEPLQRALRQGQALVLLDGLDEVRAELRALVRDAVQDFSHTYARSRLLVTCRTLSYQDPAWQLEAARFSTFELAPFDEGQIKGFIEAWYRELADLGAARPEEVGALAARLRQAVRRPDLWRLAPNPLLLTVMALVHAYRGRLPQARALLYEECTDMLLWRWEQQKLAAQREAVPGLRALLDQAGLQDVDLKAALWALAFEAHGAVGREDDAETTADIPEHRLLYALCDLHPTQSLDWAKGVVAQIKERAGLLVEREPGVYAFPHRTFQEYLAGCHLSVQADFPEQAAALAGEADFWRQVHVSVALAGPRALVARTVPC